MLYAPRFNPPHACGVQEITILEVVGQRQKVRAGAGRDAFVFFRPTGATQAVPGGQPVPPRQKRAAAAKALTAIKASAQRRRTRPPPLDTSAAAAVTAPAAAANANTPVSGARGPVPAVREGSAGDVQGGFAGKGAGTQARAPGGCTPQSAVRGSGTGVGIAAADLHKTIRSLPPQQQPLQQSAVAPAPDPAAPGLTASARCAPAVQGASGRPSQPRPAQEGRGAVGSPAALCRLSLQHGAE